MKAPELKRGLTRFETSHRGVDLLCDFEFEEGERGSREDGLQMEPDLEPSAALCHAWAGDVDVVKLLDESDIEEIEYDFLNQEVEA